MIHYISVDPQGKIINAGSTGGFTSVEQFREYEPDVILIDEPIQNALSSYWDGVKVLPIPVKPSSFHVFGYATKLWEDPRSLADFKAAQWLLIKQARSQAEYAGFTWEGSTFDSDATSQNRITGAVTLAQMSTAFSIDWILANNTIRVLNQVDMLQVGAALGNHVAEQFSKGVTYRTAIDAAFTIAEVQAVVWE